MSTTTKQSHEHERNAPVYESTRAKRSPSLSWECSWPERRGCRESLRRCWRSVQPRASVAKSPSIERRLARFLANHRIDVASVWTPLLSQFLRFWRDQRLVFVLDGTSIDERASIVYLGLLVHSRLLPVSWQLMPVHEPWQQRQWSLVGALLDRVIPFLGAAGCTLLADRGLAGLPLVQLCQARGWHFVLRISRQQTCQPQQGRWAGSWRACGGLVTRRGQQWFGPALVWQEHHLGVNPVWWLSSVFGDGSMHRLQHPGSDPRS